MHRELVSEVSWHERSSIDRMRDTRCVIILWQLMNPIESIRMFSRERDTQIKILCH